MSERDGQLNKVWEVACSRLRAKSESLYSNWIARMVPVGIDGQTITVGVDHDFTRDFILDNWGDLLEEALAGIDGVDYVLNVEAGHEMREPVEPESEPVAEAAPEVVPQPKAFPVSRPRLAEDANEFSFENFIVGDENRHAFAAALATAEEPGKIYNPLFLFGANGVGKTHLLQAVARELRRRNPALVIRDTTCDEILNDFYDLLTNKRSLSSFRSSLRDVDVLLVDDIHRLAKKTHMQEEFFNIFNTLYRQHKQIILTSDRQPCEISDIDKRLTTRFESGMISEVGMPEFEERLAMLRLWQSKMLTPHPLAEAFLEFLAESISSSVRRLKSAYYRLATYSSLNGGALTLSLAEELLHAQLVQENAARTVSVENIQSAVAKMYGISIADILSEKKVRTIAEPRLVAMYLSRVLTKHSSTEIGEAFARNHATILYAEKQVPKLCAKNESLRMTVSQLERQLKH